MTTAELGIAEHLHMPADMANASVAQGSASMAEGPNHHRPAEVVSDAAAQGLPVSDAAYDALPHGLTEMGNDSVPQGLADADMAYNAEPCGPTDSELQFQYIEIVPLGSPKPEENSKEYCSDEVKEEIKQEPEDVCNYYYRYRYYCYYY